MAALDSPEESVFSFLHSRPNNKKKKKSKTGKRSFGSPQNEVQIGQFSKRESVNSSVSLSSRYSVPDIQDQHYNVPNHIRPKKSHRSDGTNRGVVAGTIPDEFTPESIIGNMSLPLTNRGYFSPEFREPVQPFFPNRGQSSVICGKDSLPQNTSETNPIYRRVPFEDCYCSSYSGVSTQNPEHSTYALPYDSPYTDTAFRDRSRILFSAYDFSQSSHYYSQSQPSGNAPYDYGKHYGPSKGVFSQHLHSRKTDLHNPDVYYGRQF